MEQISKTVEQALTNWQQSLPDTTNKTEISLYGEGMVNSEVLADCVIKLKKSFPKLPIGWYDILQELLVAEKFTNQRLIDATNNLIKNCPYPEPTLAQLIGHDKKAKLWTYSDIMEYTKDFSAERRARFWDTLEIHDIDKNLWRSK